jgi:hypothetical protein
MTLVETNIYGETFTHKVLWECCLRQIDTAKRRKKGQQYFHITAMLMAYLTYEAYINFLGDRFAPDIWANERKFFSKGKYRGIEGKLKKIQERCPLTGIKKGQRPYLTIKKLKELRDFLSHCKPDKYEKTIVHSRDNEPPLFGKYDKLETLVSQPQADIAVADVKEFIEFLHKQAAKHTKDIWFGKEALAGITAHSFSDSRLKAGLPAYSAG